MRARTPKTTKPEQPDPGPNDEAYLEYGSLTESKSRSRGRGRAGGSADGPERPLWMSALRGLAILAIPLGLLVLSSLWKNSSEAPLPSKAQLTQQRAADKKTCDAEARVETSSGLRLDPRARDTCLVELGWTLDANHEPVECIGPCLAHAVDIQ